MKPTAKTVTDNPSSRSRFLLWIVAVVALVTICTVSVIDFSSERQPHWVELGQRQTIALHGHSASATAFFQITRDFVDLTVILADPQDGGAVVRAGARLIDGQVINFVHGGDDDDPLTRTVFTFKRDGFDVIASHAPAGSLDRQLFASVFEIE